jgi:hypothetical protein
MSNPFFQGEQLRAFVTQLYETKYPLPEIELMGLPLVQGANAGADDVAFDIVEGRGRAKFASLNETSLPLVNQSVRRTTLPMESQELAYDFSNMEMLAMSTGNMPMLSEMRARNARQGIADLQNVLACFGSNIPAALLPNNSRPRDGHQGLYNHSLASTVALASAGTWATKTAENIYKDMKALIDSIPNLTRSIEFPTVVVIPNAQLRASENVFFLNTSMPAIEKLRMARPNIRIVGSELLSTAGAGGTARMVAFDASQVSRLLAVQFAAWEPQRVGLTMSIPCYGISGGVLAPYPKSIAYMDGI